MTELPKDNSSFAFASLSSSRIGSLPLFCLTGVQAVWSILHASSPYPEASEGTGLPGTDLLGCWP